MKLALVSRPEAAGNEFKIGFLGSFQKASTNLTARIEIPPTNIHALGIGQYLHSAEFLESTHNGIKARGQPEIDGRTFTDKKREFTPVIFIFTGRELCEAPHPVLDSDMTLNRQSRKMAKTCLILRALPIIA